MVQIGEAGLNGAGTLDQGHAGAVAATATRPRADDGVVGRASQVARRLAVNALACEVDRRLVEENITALEGAGLLRAIVPRRNRGLGAGLVTQTAVAIELARGCSSSAWVQAIYNVSGWAASRLSPAGQEELFWGGAPAWVCGVPAPTGTAVAVDGGHLVTGEWRFASGCLHANWFTAGVVVVDAQGDPVDHGIAYLPAAEVEILDTWHVVGMRGTGSNTFRVSERFVPVHRMARNAVFREHLPDDDDRSDRWPIGAVLALVLTGPLLGMGDALLEMAVGGMPSRSSTYSTYARQVDSPVALHELARAQFELQSAKLQVFEWAATLDRLEAGQALPVGERAALRGACGASVALVRRAAERVLDVTGAGAFSESNPMQRVWRDLSVASRHAFLAEHPNLEASGRGLFDLPSNLTIL